MKQRFQDLYMDFALRSAKMSRATRLQVGCVIVKNDNIIAYSWNGTPSGWPNHCEANVFAQDDDGWTDLSDEFPFVNDLGQRFRKVTLDEVLHAETNALSKLAKSHASADAATMFCTHAPCIHCAKMIYQSGITELIYNEVYRSSEGLTFLKNAKVQLTKYAKDE